MNNLVKGSACRTKPWNKGKLVGQKAPLRVSEIWAIRVRLKIFGRARDLALFYLAIDSKLRGCDLLQLRVNDVCHGGHLAARASVMQQKTKQPVEFELTAGTRKSLADWIANSALRQGDFLFPSRISDSAHISTRQYAHIVHQWFDEIGLDPTAYGTHTMRRTKPTIKRATPAVAPKETYGRATTRNSFKVLSCIGSIVDHRDHVPSIRRIRTANAKFLKEFVPNVWHCSSGYQPSKCANSV